MNITEEQEYAEIKGMSKNIPIYNPETFIPSVKNGDKYSFPNGRITSALGGSYLNCDNMEACSWLGFGFWLVCHMKKVY